MSLYGAFTTSADYSVFRDIVLVLPLMEENLDHLRRRYRKSGIKMSHTDLSTVGFQIFSGLEYLHAHGIIHRVSEFLVLMSCRILRRRILAIASSTTPFTFTFWISVLAVTWKAKKKIVSPKRRRPCATARLSAFSR